MLRVVIVLVLLNCLMAASGRVAVALHEADLWAERRKLPRTAAPSFAPGAWWTMLVLCCAAILFVLACWRELFG
jgi:hypothetical protein